jgi:hypothetical protein
MAIIISVQATFNITVTFLALLAPAAAVPVAVVAPAAVVVRPLVVPAAVLVRLRPLVAPAAVVVVRPLRTDLVGACIQENVDK